MLSAFYGLATPLLSQRFGGEVGEIHWRCDHGHLQQPRATSPTTHYVRLERDWSCSARWRFCWLIIRLGHDLASASIAATLSVRELGGPGRVAYEVIGDTINVGSRLESEAPVGGVLIGSETFRRLPPEFDGQGRGPVSELGASEHQWTLMSCARCRLERPRHGDIATDHCVVERGYPMVRTGRPSQPSDVPLAGRFRPPTVQGPRARPSWPRTYPLPTSAFRSARGPLLPSARDITYAPRAGFEPA